MSNRATRDECPEKNLGLFLTPADGASGGGFVVPMDNLNVGPGKPGPGDDWKVPMGHLETDNDVRLEPLQSRDGTGRLAASAHRQGVTARPHPAPSHVQLEPAATCRRVRLARTRQGQRHFPRDALGELVSGQGLAWGNPGSARRLDPIGRLPERFEPDECLSHRFLTSRPEVNRPSLAIGGQDGETAGELCAGRTGVSAAPRCQRS